MVYHEALHLQKNVAFIDQAELKELTGWFITKPYKKIFFVHKKIIL